MINWQLLSVCTNNAAHFPQKPGVLIYAMRGSLQATFPVQYATLFPQLHDNQALWEKQICFYVLETA